MPVAGTRLRARREQATVYRRFDTCELEVEKLGVKLGVESCTFPAHDPRAFL